MGVLDPEPKYSVKYLVNRREELRSVIEGVLNHKIVVLLGPRRVGKTSILKCVANILLGKEKLDDLRIKGKRLVVYVNMWEVIAYGMSWKYFFNILAQEISKALYAYLEEKAREAFESSVYGTSVIKEKSAGVEAKFVAGAKYASRQAFQLSRPAIIPRVIESLNEVCRQFDVDAVLMIDEAQELSNLKGFSSCTWLAHIHDDLPRIRVVLSGSYVGIMKRILEPRRLDPLYGRDIYKVEIGKMSPSSMVELMIRGFEERKIVPSEKFSEVLTSLLKDVSGVPPRLLSTLPFTSGGFSDILSTYVMFMSSLSGPESEEFRASVLYYIANKTLKTLKDTSSFGKLPDILSRPGGRALALISLLTFSGLPGPVIRLIKKLKNGFNEEDLYENGMKILEEESRAVCDEVRHFIKYYARKPEILTKILTELAKEPKSFTEILKLTAASRSTIAEDLKVLQRLGYISKIPISMGVRKMFYYISDPLLLIAILKKCID